MLQYLILNNHLQSAKAFKHQSSLTWKQLLLTSFTKGNREQFFSIFDLLRKQQKLQFYLRVYFLIYSIHPHINVNARTNAIPQKEINSFREFLDTKGADLAKTSQFLQFYALPFIKKPLEHGAFKTLFGKSWVGNLKDKLNVYIGIEQQSMKNAVKLQLSPPPSQIYSKQPTKQQPFPTSSPSQYEQKFLLLQKKNKQLFQQLEQIKETYHHLEQNHQQMIEDFNQYMMDSQNKWFQSYKQLVKTSRGLLQIVGGLSGDNPKLQRKYIQAKRKIEKYQRFVARKLQDLLTMSQDISVFDKPSVNEISQYTMKSGYTSKSWLNNNYTNANNITNNPNLGQKNLLLNNNSQVMISNKQKLQSINYTRTQNQNNITSYVQIDQYIATNFNKLNLQFNGNKLSGDQVVTIIEGFSWRLLKSKTPLIRRFYCISMITSNFIGLGRVDPKSKNKDLQLCTKYLTPNNTNNRSQQLTDSILQLLNYMKVDYYSRQWLFKQNNIVYPLMQTMAEQLQQNNLQSFLIALDILSTISAYKDYRRAIIQTQLPIFLLNILQSYPKLFQSQQLMQLIMMILMNVSSFHQGLQLLSEYENIFSTLSVAFQHQYHDIIMLVNGFYYTLLGDRGLYQLAIESNMLEFVKYLLSMQQYKQHEKQLKFILSRLEKFQGNDQQQHDNKQQPQDLFLIDSQTEYEQIEIIEDQMDNLQQYIRAHQQLTNKYSLYQAQAEEQQRHVQLLNQQFVKKIQMIRNMEMEQKLKEKQEQNNNGRGSFGKGDGNNNNNKQIVQLSQLNNKPFTIIKNIPVESRPIVKKPVQQQQKYQQLQLSNKNQQIQLQNKKQQQKQQQYTTIKQEIFRSPPSKTDTVAKTQQSIPGNSKQAQFMGLLSKEKNPTFAKQKTQGNEKYNSPNVAIPDHMNLPNFGSYTPPAQLAPQQKTRRKQLLKQLNEEIQSKQKQKVQKHKSKLQFDKVFQQNKVGQKRQASQKDLQNGPKATRGNAHMKKQDDLKQKPVKQKLQERKAFESRPKIHRTPPKDDQ